MSVRRAAVLLAVVTLLAAPAMPGGAAVVADDPLYLKQWGLHRVGAEQAWLRGTGEGVTIAVVDTGIDLGHDDLAENVVAHVSCVGAADDPSRCGGSGQDDHGHGTHVAGIAAAVTGNGKGVAGAAPRAQLMAVKVLEPDPATGGSSGTLRDIRAGIRWAVDNGADVVNLSLGENVVVRNLLGSGLGDAIRYAWDNGVIPVIATGNTSALLGSGYGTLPVVVVTATNRQDRKASYATRVGNARWGMAAPGGEGPDDEGKIVSTWCPTCDDEGARYAYATGTSMAVPHVSGAAAVLRSLGLSHEETVERILETAVDLGSPGRDIVYGHGRLDMAAATEGFPERPAGAAASTSHETTPVETTPVEPPPAPPLPVVAAAPPTTSNLPTTSSVPPETTTTEPPTTTTDPPPTTLVPPPTELAPDESALPAGETSEGPLGAWAVIGATALAVVVLGVRGVWLRRSTFPTP